VLPTLDYLVDILHRSKKPVIEGFFIETLEGLIFDVKGLLHPPDRIIAYVRYIPNTKGDRVSRRGIRYRKIYSLLDREKFLEKKYPYYIYYDPIFGRRLQGVPLGSIRYIYDPIERLKELMHSKSLDPLEKAAVELVEEVAERAGISRSTIGITGSILVGLHSSTSDIDLVVYGEKEGISVYRALLDMSKERVKIRPYNEEELERLFIFRSRDTFIPLDTFLKIERKKILQGIFKGREYFIRLVKRPEEFGEKYGDRRYKPIGRVRLRAIVSDTRDSIFTPCRYILDKVKVISGHAPKPIKEVVSYRGRFREQARKGDTVIVEGVVELVENEESYCRVLVGEYPRDILIPEEV